jgi:glycerol-3-phosphate O-acyltransferase
MVNLREVDPDDRIQKKASDAPSDRSPRRSARGPGPGADPDSAMASRFNLFFRWFARRFFVHFDLDDAAVARIRALEERGAVVYVMRYSSRLDYVLFNTLFLREGLRLSSFANGIRLSIYRPVWQALRQALFRKRGRPQAVVHEEQQQYVRRLTAQGESFFLFMRTQRLRTFWRGLWRMRHRQDELDLLHEVVRETWNGDRDVSVVPLSIFWRKGPRRSPSRFLNLDYGSLSRPSDLAKVGSFLLNYRSLSVKIGEPVDLRAYVAAHRDDGQVRVTRTVRRSLLIHLYREEKVVEGPTLRPAPQVLREILADPGVRAAMQERAAQKRGSMEKAERDVERFHREIAARMNSTLLALLALAVRPIVRRLFSTIEADGLGKVAEHAKRHPLVLVPTHRSYFDFIIISLLFYNSYLVPPHIAARDNMAFGPFGLIFRMAGAFYLRKSFDDPLYKQVFRAYVAHLVREGFTQEFFIEGGRSRTGKTLAPRLGMVTWDVDAFLECSRRDLFFVPVAITYERLVEESGMVDELEGGRKTNESTLALFRARKYLRRRFGSVHVRFGEPISLADAMGERRDRFEREVRGEVAALVPGGSEDEVAELAGRIAEEKRAFVEDLGHGIVERINWSVVANATSVVSAVLLGAPHRGLLREELARRARQIVELLRAREVRMTSALRADQADFSESIAFMLRSDLIQSMTDVRGEILYFEESRRRALDIYRNSIVHYLAAPSILARGLLAGGATHKQLVEDLASWLEVLYREYFTPDSERGPETVERLLDHFDAMGWIESGVDGPEVTAAGRPILGLLAAQTQGVIECYEAVARSVLDAELPIGRKALLAAAAHSFQTGQLLGLSERVEAANDTTFGNAIELLRDRGVLAVERGEPGRRGAAGEARYAPGEHFDRLPALHAWLASAAAAR